MRSHQSGDVAVLPHPLGALAAAAAAHPLERKLVIGARTGVGRELLRALAARSPGWVGFEATTPDRLAHEIAAVARGDVQLELADEFDEAALLEECMDAALHGDAGRLAGLATAAGLRRAIAASIRALRYAGYSAPELGRVRFRDEDKRAQLARILSGYETRLARSGRLDGAGVLAAAVAVLEAAVRRGTEAPEPLHGARLYLLPGQRAAGLAGRLIGLLLDLGAELLPDEPVFGLEPPAGLLVPPGPRASRAPRGRAAGPQAAPAEAIATGASPLCWLHDVAGWTTAAESAAAGVPGAVPGAGAARASAGRSQDGAAAGEVVLDVFAASSVTAELREVLRRVVSEGLHWDEVEIVATDVVAYGVALDGLAQRLGIPLSHAAGLPLVRTRPGRAVAHYLRWVQHGLPAERLRQMLEHGDLVPPTAPEGGRDGVAVSGVALARRLRALRIGRGRSQFEAGLARLDAAVAASAAPTGPEDERSPEELDAEVARQRTESAALGALLRRLLDVTPTGDAYSPAELAAGVLAVLELAPPATHADRMAAARLTARLGRVRHTLTRPTDPAAAVSVIAAELDARVAPPGATGAAPWSATGGHLHLSDLEHGGRTGRRATFVVGLDAGRFPGAPGGDALLVDEDRRRLAEVAPSPTAAAALRPADERTAEKRYAFASLLARLRGRVTFSYATWDAVEGRAVAPASELLQVYRLICGDPTADYEALHAATAPPASAVPRGGGLLDANDVWLHLLAHDPPAASAADSGGPAEAPGGAGTVGTVGAVGTVGTVGTVGADAGRRHVGGEGRALRHGVPAVCALYPQLGMGVAAWKARLRSGSPTAHHGFIAVRPWLDPRHDVTAAPSATRLETLGACAHRYLLRYVLQIRPPEDPDLSPGQWLSPLERGRLLHAVFERALREAALDDIDLDHDAFAVRALHLLDDEVSAARLRLPPPGEAVFVAEAERMREDVRAFVAMAREDGMRFVALERKFGRDGEAPVTVALPDGSALSLAGAIDRVDRLDDGTLAIIDYKTGSSLRFGGRNGAYDGGRRLQHVLYAAAAEELFGAPVSRAEYHFPSRRSENHRARYGRSELTDGLAVVVDLLELARRGWFLPTNDPDDCRFCEFAAVCRVRTDAYGKVVSPLADWSREVDAEAAEVLRELRRGRPAGRVRP